MILLAQKPHPTHSHDGLPELDAALYTMRIAGVFACSIQRDKFTSIYQKAILGENQNPMVTRAIMDRAICRGPSHLKFSE